MTIRVTVKNEDSRAEAIIAVHLINTDGTPRGSSPASVLAGGESVEVLVYKEQQVTITELKNG